MEFRGKDDNGRLQFAFTHGKNYQEMQFHFLDCLQTHDPQSLSTYSVIYFDSVCNFEVNLLRIYPCHIDALLQMSEVYKQTGDVARSGEAVGILFSRFALKQKLIIYRASFAFIRKEFSCHVSTR